MPLPVKMVRPGTVTSGSAAESSSSNASANGTSLFPHLLPKLKERFKHEDYRSSLQRAAVEAVVQSQSFLNTNLSHGSFYEDIEIIQD